MIENKQKFISQKKLERLSALNALLNMDEKGDNAIGMDDAPEEETITGEKGEKAADEPVLYPVQIAGQSDTVGSGSLRGLKPAVGMADKPAQKASLKEKLEAFKVKAAGGAMDKAIPKKAKDKEETL